MNATEAGLRRDTDWVWLGVVVPLAAVAVVDLLCPTFWVMALVRVPLLFALPAAFLGRSITLEECALPAAATRRSVLTLAAVALVVTMAALYVVCSSIDLSLISQGVVAIVGPTAGSFVLPALYIPSVNAFVEEYFFRVVVPRAVSRSGGTVMQLIVSSVLFSLYHGPLLFRWLSVPQLLATLTLLALGGGLLFELKRRCGSMWASWIVHAAVNVSINVIALLCVYP